VIEKIGLPGCAGQARATEQSQTPPSSKLSPAKSQVEAASADRRPQAREIARVLRARFPATFGSPNRPLKCGVRQDIVRSGLFTDEQIGAALASHCASFRYLRSVRENAVRVDLNGEPAGVVTRAEAVYARERITRIRARQAVKPQPKPESGRAEATDTQSGGAPGGAPAPTPAKPVAPRSRPVIDIAGQWKRASP
jgi:ProP effector